jgi:hypothetical protein
MTPLRSPGCLAGPSPRSPVRDSAAAMGSTLQAELDAGRYNADLLEQRWAARWS